jgi:hypothetical protein
LYNVQTPKTQMDKALDAVLWAADDDLCVLVAAVGKVLKERNYDRQGAQREMEEVVARLREDINDEAYWRRPRLVRAAAR